MNEVEVRDTGRLSTGETCRRVQHLRVFFEYFQMEDLFNNHQSLNIFPHLEGLKVIPVRANVVSMRGISHKRSFG